MTRKSNFRLLRADRIKLPPLTLRSDPTIDDGFVSSVKDDMIEPVIVRPLKDSDAGYFELVCGFRRYAAAKEAELREIPCRVVELGDLEARTLMLRENLDRVDVPPMEEADFIVRMMRDHDLSQEQVANFLHRDKSTVSNLLRVRHDPVLSKKVRKGEHSLQSALELLSTKPNLEKEGAAKLAEWEGFVDKTSGMSAKRVRLEAAKRLDRPETQECQNCGETVARKVIRLLALCRKCVDKLESARDSPGGTAADGGDDSANATAAPKAAEDLR